MSAECTRLRGARRQADRMEDVVAIICPYCGEEVEVYLEPDLAGTFVQDCEVCCNPWRVRIAGRGDDRWVDVAKADGSEP